MIIWKPKWHILFLKVFYYDPLDSSNINDLPLLKIPINSVFYTIPKKKMKLLINLIIDLVK